MTPPPPPVEAATTVTCTRAFWSDRHHTYAFTFTLPGTQQRFTVYTADPYRFEIGATYAITLTATAPPPGPPEGPVPPTPHQLDRWKAP